MFLCFVCRSVTPKEDRKKRFFMKMQWEKQIRKPFLHVHYSIYLCLRMIVGQVVLICKDTNEAQNSAELNIAELLMGHSACIYLSFANTADSSMKNVNIIHRTDRFCVCITNTRTSIALRRPTHTRWLHT